MNKRINELAIQCGGIWRGGYVNVPNGDSVYTDKKFVDGSELNVTQFAELIVQECANFIEPLGDYCGGHGEPREPSTRECAEKLKQHFGIN